MTRALIIYGSAARGDGDDQSDLDVLLVTAEGTISSAKIHSLEVHAFPADHLFSLAESGDLFALHIAWEGRACIDEINFLPRLKNKIKIKRSYAREISHASRLGHYILDHSRRYSNDTLINKRIAWCVRTIMISKLVERGVIAFAPKVLLDHYPEGCSRRLISLRRSDVKSARRLSDLSAFLDKYGLPKSNTISEEAYARIFRKSGNGVGTSTLKALRKSNIEPRSNNYTAGE